VQGTSPGELSLNNLPEEVADSVRVNTERLRTMFPDVFLDMLSGNGEYEVLYRPVMDLLAKAKEATAEAEVTTKETLMEILRELRDTTAFCESLMPFRSPEVVRATAKMIDEVATQLLRREPMLGRLGALRARFGALKIKDKATRFEELKAQVKTDIDELKKEYEEIAKELLQLGEEVKTGAVGAELNDRIVQQLGDVEHVQEVRAQMEEKLNEISKMFDILGNNKPS
jgi:hypothetical protein